MEERPRGPDQVRKAIIVASRQRFAREGPSASLRDIASDANVNLGLLHRYFGNKDTLIRAVFSDAAEQGSAEIRDLMTMDDGLDALIGSASSSDRSYARMLAGMLLAGKRPQDLRDDFPVMERLATVGGEDGRPRALLAQLAVFGWAVFAEHLTTAFGYASEKAAWADVAGLLEQIGSDSEAD